jgi:hypothetical protein
MSKPSRTVGETPYHRLSAREKRSRFQGGLNEPPVTCVQCETQVPVGQMPRHLETCVGKPREHHLDQWIPWSEVKTRGISKQTLSDWVKREQVQVKGEMGARLYRVRDLDLMQSKAASPGNRTSEGT